jgi:hypothetical protein
LKKLNLISAFFLIFQVITFKASADALLFENTTPDSNTTRLNEDDKSGAHTSLDAFDGYEATPKLKEKLKNGTYQYETNPSPQKQGSNIRFGSYSFSNLTNDTNNLTYQQLYNSKNVLLLSVDYEYQFFKTFGKLGLKGGLGFFTAKGFGHFIHTPALASDTVFTLYGFPLTLAPVYHFQVAEGQILVPFVEGGLDYFAFSEYRDDKTSLSQSLKFGGGAAAHWAAGLQLQLDFLDRQALLDLDREYGVNHMYLTGDFRQIVGLSNIFDFSGTIIEGGFLIEF